MITLREYSLEAARDWDYEQNGNMTPDNVSYGSPKKAYLKCQTNSRHTYKRVIHTIIDKSGKYIGCPYCNGTRAFPGENDFFTICLEAKDFWDFNKNPSDLNPTELLPKSDKMAHFKCSNGHSFSKKIIDFTKTPRCLECDRIYLREHSLEATRDWDYEQNGNMTPDNVPYHSPQKAYFKCQTNSRHTYKRVIHTIIDKSGKYRGCPYCNGTRAFPGENDFFTICLEAKEFWDFDKNPSDLNPTELLPKSGKMVHFKCSNGHSFSKKIIDFTKTPRCLECDRISLREHSLEATRDWDYERNGSVTPDNVSYRSQKIAHFICNLNPEHKYDRHIYNILNRKGDYIGCPYCNGSRAFPGETDFFTKCPKAKGFWDYDKNPSNLDPTKLLRYSNVNAHFKCISGHQFKRHINQFTSNPTCPYCNGSRAITGETDFFTVCPEAKDFWDYDKNPIDLAPTEILPFSEVNAHFKCISGHQFKRNINHFTSNPTCPYCNGSRAITGETDFFTVCPEAKDFWDYDKNPIDLVPTEILPFSEVNAHFKCAKNHQFEKKIFNFTYVPKCIICSYAHIEPGLNSLKAEYPLLVKDEWNFLANAILGDPDTISPLSSNKYFWKCKKCSNTYTSTIKGRIEVYIRGQIACPICKGMRNKYSNY